MIKLELNRLKNYRTSVYTFLYHKYVNVIIFVNQAEFIEGISEIEEDIFIYETAGIRAQ